MYEIDSKLAELENTGSPIQVALIGAGQMGTDIIAQVECMVGMDIPVVCDLSLDLAEKGYRVAGYTGEIVRTNEMDEAIEAVQAGKKVATENYRLAVTLPMVEVVIDATGSPEMGARVSLDCINNGKHIVMMNVECDITVGPILRQMAENAGVVYSLTAGDEPGSIVEVYRFAKALGFKVVAAGKGKNNPLNIYATPDEWEEKAKARNMSAKMLVEFVDGSKTMIEMAAVSNATGLVPDVRGMHGPKCNVKDLTTVFATKEQGGILEKEGVVDFGIGDINPGVFVIVTTDKPRLIEGLVQRDMGNGPNYLLYRPYHLCSIETPITAAQAVLYGESTAHPLKKLTSECITVAKQDLKAGQTLDGIGEYCYRASIELADVAANGNMLPVGLAKGAVLTCDVKKDEVITYDMVTLNEKSVLLQLRRIQDQMYR
ncbi:NAD(P)H-dependent oxidoreductase [Massiliimalia timonensis]|uniref:NAD(P)H-dependent oxidoreductase n=1 Tax=Massiliimalia timonensis TaxID=1987501 RepID=UPI00189C77B6|nr:SAF domain-containing protein [Massiliimalia timonensis]